MSALRIFSPIHAVVIASALWTAQERTFRIGLGWAAAGTTPHHAAPPQGSSAALTDIPASGGANGRARAQWTLLRCTPAPFPPSSSRDRGTEPSRFASAGNAGSTARWSRWAAVRGWGPTGMRRRRWLRGTEGVCCLQAPGCVPWARRAPGWSRFQSGS